MQRPARLCRTESTCRVDSDPEQSHRSWRLPFEARGPSGWVHCHVARAPPPPSALVPGLSQVLSALVLKLLAKAAEDRYQTARGLEHDLAWRPLAARVTGGIEPFPLAERDVSGRFPGTGATFLVELPCAGPPRLGEPSAPPG
ncbi:hypothetical protein WMF38_56390 [Sorangium sp. So ce118]